MSEKKISKGNTTTRLYSRDEVYIRTKIRALGKNDARFKDNSSALRHYVSIGIYSEKKTSAINSLDDRIIKGSQKEVVTESLLPIKLTLDNLITAIKQLGKRQEQHFTEASKQTDTLIRRVEGLSEFLTNQFATVLKQVLLNGKLTEESLRNVIVLRSILYVFLLAYKTGKLEPNERIGWEDIIALAHKKAQQFSVEEIQHLAEDRLETSLVRQMANEMFAEISKAQNKLSLKT